jgi:hypothetical protein
VRLKSALSTWFTSGSLIVVGFVTSITLLFSILVQNVWFMIFAVGLTLALTTLGALTGSARIFAQEIEEKRWEMLLMTSLTPVQIVGAKVGAAFINQIPLLAALMLLLILSAISMGENPIYIVPTMLVMGTFSAFLLVAGAFLSLVGRNLRRAFVFTLGLVLLLLVLVPIGAAMARDLDYLSYRDSRPILETTNPFYYLGLMEEALTSSGFKDPVHGRHFMAALGFVFFYGSLTVLSGAGLLLGFRRLAYRTG